MVLTSNNLRNDKELTQTYEEQVEEYISSDYHEYYWKVGVWKDWQASQMLNELGASNIYEVAVALGYELTSPGHSRYAKILCPFHDDNNPSCVLWKDINAYKCYSCGAKGDIKKFIEETRRK